MGKCRAFKVRVAKSSRKRSASYPTFIPQWLSNNLIAGCLGFLHWLGLVVLLNLGIVVLSVASVLVKGRQLHGLFNGRDVD